MMLALISLTLPLAVPFTLLSCKNHSKMRRESGGLSPMRSVETTKKSEDIVPITRNSEEQNPFAEIPGCAVGEKRTSKEEQCSLQQERFVRFSGERIFDLQTSKITRNPIVSLASNETITEIVDVRKRYGDPAESDDMITLNEDHKKMRGSKENAAINTTQNTEARNSIVQEPLNGILLEKEEITQRSEMVQWQEKVPVTNKQNLTCEPEKTQPTDIVY
ncbi:hypothetical protein RB195_011086 [Necator americanus]|uniref:Uncharacterized protein n=1 Tax=Necator americanus TaxID=51031 RepID=A0ABR1D0W4_NECAM